MLDIKLIRDQTDKIKGRLAARGTGAKIDEVLALDEKRRALLAEVEALKSQRNRVSKEIGALMGQKKLAEAEAKKAITSASRSTSSALWTWSAPSKAKHGLRSQRSPL